MQSVIRTLALVATGSALTACVGPLDVLGNETVVSERAESDRPEDDRIQDKNPAYDPDLAIVETFDYCPVKLNKSGSVAKLDLIELPQEAQSLGQRLFPSRAEAIAAIDAAGLRQTDLIPSMEVVNGRLKPFDNGLYAAIELSMQEGIDGALPGKRQLLHDLIDATAARLPEATPAQAAHLDDARVFLAAALLASGQEVTLPTEMQSAAQALADRFLEPPDPLAPNASQPIGFYTWSPALTQIYRQDRFLQNLDPAPSFDDFGAFAALAAVLQGEPDLLDRYQQVLALYAGLTNPYASYTPVDLMAYVPDLAALSDVSALRSQFEAENPDPVLCPVTRYAFLPASRSKDSEYYSARWCYDTQPEGTSFIDELIAAIRSGDLDLTPSPDSGWYDYQLYALETLLLPERGPESDHLLLTAAYKEKLIDTFRSLITQHRESHVKQLGSPGVGVSAPAETEVYPLYPVEPFPTFYLRTARGYRFLQLYLEAVLGAEVMTGTARLDEDGTRPDIPLSQELAQTIELVYGLYALSARSVGLRPEDYLLAEETADIDMDAATDRARSWLDTWRTDPDVLADPRVIAPVSTDDGTGQGVYWATLGVEAVLVEAAFVDGYEPEIIPDPASCEVTGFVPHHYVLLVERMAEVRFAGPPPTRDEFRALCDQYDNADDIIAALEARQ